MLDSIRPALAPLARGSLTLAKPGAPLPGSSRIHFRIRGHPGPIFRPVVSSRGPAPTRAVSGPHSQRALSPSVPLGAARDSAPSGGSRNPQTPVFSRSGPARHSLPSAVTASVRLLSPPGEGIGPVQ